MLHNRHFLVMLHHSKNFRELMWALKSLDKRHRGEFLKNSPTFNIVPLRRSWAQNVQTGHQED